MKKKFIEYINEQNSTLPVHFYLLTQPEFFKSSTKDSRSKFHNTDRFPVRVSSKPAESINTKYDG